MGVSGSVPATPTAPRNKHLAHVRDPRSPSVGILRTPIEVVSSPVDSPQPGPAEPAVGTSQDWDPRSPTPGISRTPMRAVSSDSVDRLVKQLSEAFGDEAASPEPSAATRPPEEVAAAEEEPARRGSPLPAVASGEEAERLPSPSPSPGAAPARSARIAGPGFSSVGSKPIRRKTNNKIMATSGGTGRSPLSILQDDNSPGAPAPRQGKRHVLGENIGEKKEVIVDLSRSLKSGNCAWSNLNKENQQCPFVEN
ncbi:cell division cycle-associated protein 3 isoform X1 [Numenius arquata]|uniref:cell division cycle-associated protein 3 isoform X1 n=1 Tax=Numenius arquata TaxID=31919 RepID=UPI003D30B732